MFDIVAIGTATRDVFLESPLFKTVHDPQHLAKLGFVDGDAQCFALGAKVEVGAPLLTIGGGAANAAVTFSQQGLRSAALVKIGNDQNGQAVLEDLKKKKVTPIAIFDKKEMTAYSVILLAKGGERTILNYRGASKDLRNSEIPYAKLRSRWAYIVPGNIPLGTMKKIIAHLRSGGARIAMNPSRFYVALGPARLRSILRELDVIFVNREEAAALTGVAYANERGIFRAFDKLVSGLAVMTDGPRGSLVSDGERMYGAGIFPQTVVDRTGAGDAFGSGFVTALARSRANNISPDLIRDAIQMGTANATAVVQKIGAQAGILTKHEAEASKWKKLSITTTNLS